jgi:mannosyltransferase
MSSPTGAAARAPAPPTRRDRLAGALRRLTGTPLIPVAVAIVLGLYRGADESLWLDEAVSVAIARLPTADMLVHLWRVELHAAPYYVALHPWLALGDGEAAIRSLSVVFGVVAVLATWAVGRRFGVGFTAALVLAVLPAFVRYEQEARGYTLLMAASATATLLFLRLVERPDRWRIAPYVVVAGGLIYIHPLGALVVVAHALAALWLRPRAEWPRLLLPFVPAVVLWLPMVRFALLNRDRIDWIPPTTPEVVAGELTVLAGGVVVALVAGVLIAINLRRDVITPWLIVPLAGTVVASLLIQPMLQDRYLVAVLPAVAIVIARSHRLMAAAFVAVAMTGVWAAYEDTSGKTDWRGAAAHVSAATQPGDGIVFSPYYIRAAFGYYARVAEPVWPSLPWSESDLYPGEAEPPAVAQASRIWLVVAHVPALPPEIASALAAFVEAERHTFAGPREITVTLLVRPR